MKTPEEYIVEWQQKVTELTSIDASLRWCDKERIKFWHNALLDAFKAGMTEAAEIVQSYLNTQEIHEAGQEILSARDRKESL